MSLRIALLGSRGVPARYSGFETFYEQLGARLAERGHEVTVYNRSHFIQDVKGSYRGMRIVSLPAIRTKHLETISHTLLSSLHALTQHYDIVYYCIVGNSPLAWIPRPTGASVLLNVDGQDWARQKWGAFARAYQRWCERAAVRTAQVLIADAKVIQRRYREEYDAETVFVPYGANVARDEGLEALGKWGLEPRKYIFYVGRFVPENCIDLLIRSFLQLDTDMKLVLVGDAPYSKGYKTQLQEMADKRVVFTGYAFGKDYAQLSSHAYLSVQPSAVDGTRPALLDQMGFGNCVLVRSSAANSEVVSDCGAYFDAEHPEEDLPVALRGLIAAPERVEELRRRALTRIRDYYNWEWVTSFYEDVFARLRAGRALVSYDDFLAEVGGGKAEGIAAGEGEAPLERMSLMGVSIDAFTLDSLHGVIGDVIRGRGKDKAIVANVNIHAMNIACEQEWFRQFLNDSAYVFCDGHGVMLAARMAGMHLPKKITYADWFPRFCGFCEGEGFSLYFLGGEPGIAERAKSNLVKQFPNLKVVGCRDGFFEKRRDSAGNREVIEDINRCSPDVLLTSFGMPLQEHWLMENWGDVNARIALTGGACLDYMAGKSKRPPWWLTEYGFEWLGRLYYEPRRLWRRYLIGNPLFFLRLMRWMREKEKKG